MAADPTRRVTLFKVLRDEDRIVVLEQFKKLQQGALKDGKPYITSVNAGHILEDSRNQGFTVILQTTFATLEDMRYFDDDCTFHKEVKNIVGPRMQPPAVVAYFSDILA